MGKIKGRRRIVVRINENYNKMKDGRPTATRRRRLRTG